MEKIRIQIVSNYSPSEKAGTPYFMLDLIKYLVKNNCQIQYIVLNELEPVLIIKLSFDGFEIIVKNSRKIGFLLIRNSFKLNLLLLSKWLIPKILKRKLKKLNLTKNFMNNKKSFSSLPDIEDINLFKSLYKQFRPNIVIADYAWISGIFDHIPQTDKVLKVIFAHDLIHLRAKSLKESGSSLDVPDWSPQEEGERLQKADLVMIETDIEAKEIQKIAPNVNVLVMPKAWKYHETSRSNQIEGRCLFVGGGAPHNIYGLIWFLNNVWPLVLNEIPYAHLHICGSVGEFINRSYPNVKIRGYVRQLSKEYEEAQVCIIPLLGGTGFKIKLGEALSYGRAVVTTSVGAQGAENLNGHCIIIADSDIEFAKAICSLIIDQEKRIKMEEAAKEYVIQNMEPDKLYRKFIETARELLRNKNFII
jgi:glycosyltransferase involved in cell wall biosynthesis